MIPRSRCCSSAVTEPTSSCDATEIIPAHASQPSARALTVSDPPPTTLLTANATATAALTTLGNGWYAFDLTATPSDPKWAALLIVWFDSHQNLDPRDVGSITAITAGTKLRPATHALHNLPIAAGVALEQAGTIYLALPTRLDLPENVNPCCWYQATASASDSGACLGNPLNGAFNLPTHHPLRVNRSNATTTVLSGGPKLCPDQFGTFEPTGRIDTDNRPNLDVGIAPHPVTRWGYVIGLTNWPQVGDTAPTDYTAETHSVTATLGPICGSITSPGMGAYSDAANFNPPGQLLLDEPLDNGLPPGWSTNDDLWFDDDSSKSETGRGGGIFTSHDGATFVENSTTVDKEFATAVAWIDLPAPPPPYSVDFALTVEFTWRRISEAKRRYDTAAGWHPQDLNSQRNGIFIGGTARCLLGHQITGISGGTLSHGSILQWQQPVEDLGGFSTNGRHYPTRDIPYGWPCPCTQLPPDIDCPANGTGNYCKNDTHGYANSCTAASPEDGDRVTYQLRRNLDQFALGELDPQWAAHRYLPRVWINGRELNFGAIGLFGWIWISNPLRVGLMAYQGGGWSDFKVWFNP